MKRTLFLFLVFAFVGIGESTAQRIPDLSDVDVGVRGGLGAATLQSGDLDDAGRRLGVAIGGFARVDLTRRVGLQPELLFVQKGARIEHEGVERVHKAAYLQLPVLATYAIPVEGPLLPYVAAGPAASLRVGEGLELVLDGTSESISGEDVDLFRRTDAGLVLAGGVGFDVAPDYRLLLDARYDFGLVDVVTGTFGETVSARTSTLVVSLGVLFL